MNIQENSEKAPALLSLLFRIPGRHEKRLCETAQPVKQSSTIVTTKKSSHSLHLATIRWIATALQASR